MTPKYATPDRYLFLTSVAPELILNIDKRTYVLELVRKVGITYPHGLHLINELERRGYVTTYREGRTRYIELTDKGRKVREALRYLIDLLEG